MDIGTMVSQAWEGYQSFALEHPLLNSMSSAELMYLASDAASQLIRYKKIDLEKLAYTAKLAPLYGLIGEGIIRSANFIGEGIYDHPFVKSLATNPLGNISSAFFFVNNQLAEKNGYKLSETIKHYLGGNPEDSGENLHAKFKNRFLDHVPDKIYKKAVLLGLPYWLTAQTAIFSYAPEHMRMPSTLVCAFGWTLLASSLSLVDRESLSLPEEMDLEI
ncbi:hypothetical protein HN747_00535 [archaeon]|nr:hypothetical protein [archaeon]